MILQTNSNVKEYLYDIHAVDDFDSAVGLMLDIVNGLYSVEDFKKSFLDYVEHNGE